METETNASRHDADIELRVLRGPQVGSRLAVQHQSEYLIGAAETCAIVLTGGQVRDEHAVLRVVEGPMVVVSPLSGTVVHAAAETSEPVTLELGAWIQLGMVRVCIDRSDAPWPVDDLPLPSMASAQPQSEPPTALSGTRTESITAEARGARAQRPGPVSARIWVPLGLGGAACAAAAWILASMVIDEFAPEPSADVTLSAESVRSSAMSSPLMIAAQERAGTQRSDAARSAAMNEQLALTNESGRLDLKAMSGPNHVVTIAGTAASAQVLETALARLRAAVPDLDPVSLNVMLPEQLAARLQEELRAAGLGGRVQVRPTDGGLFVEGALFPQERARFEKALYDFNTSYGRAVDVRAQVRDEGMQLGASIQAVLGGPSPAILMTSGRRVAPGGTLEGRVVMSIREGEILFGDGLRLRLSQ